MNHSLSRALRAVAAASALSLVAAACGGGSDGVETGAGATNPTQTSEALDQSSDQPDEPEPESEPADAAVSESDAEQVNLFAPVDVIEVSSGDTLNLADELGGGDTAVLLWFWAPH